MASLQPALSNSRPEKKYQWSSRLSNHSPSVTESSPPSKSSNMTTSSKPVLVCGEIFNANAVAQNLRSLARPTRGRNNFGGVARYIVNTSSSHDQNRLCRSRSVRPSYVLEPGLLYPGYREMVLLESFTANQLQN